MDPSSEQTRRVARLFDEIAADYDQSGVAFFGPIAQGLVDLLDLRPGERVVDVGCGRGAVTIPAAAAVGPTGSVTAVDIAPAMVELTGRRATEAGLSQVRTLVVEPDDLGLPAGSADVVASSLVLFFTPDPVAALRSWTVPLVPGGRIGIATFGQPDAVWTRVDAVFQPYLPPELRDAGTTGRRGVFASDEGVEALLGSCGLSDVRTVRVPLPVRFRDAEHWRRFTLSTGQRAYWRLVPEAEHDEVMGRVAEVMEEARTDQGDLVMVMEARYTLGTRP